MVSSPLVAASEFYSPRRRTALVLTGTGTGGVYHAGVLRALHEAGVKLDIVGGHGVGAIGAMFTAIDGAPRLWEPRGFWRSRSVRHFYRWRASLRFVVGAAALCVGLVAFPLAMMAIALVVFPIDFALNIVGLPVGLAGAYVRLADTAFAPEVLPTWLPRLVLLVLGVTAAVAVVDGWCAGGARRRRGALWWRMLRPPLSTSVAVEHCFAVLWDLLRGAAPVRQPDLVEVGRRYTELLAENLGQPGFRELVIAVHDLDARRDLLLALVTDARRRALVRRPATREAEERRAEVLDLSGVAREHVPDAVAAALAIPLATEPHWTRFAPDAYWRGEVHRTCDRPSSLIRLVEELTHLGVEQIILVSAAPEAPGPHSLRPSRVDGRGRLGEYLESTESALVRDVVRNATGRGLRIFAIRPIHNAIGPLDFTGGFDDRSDRRQQLAELMGQGYEDAYHQFIEPVLGASGERVGHDAL